MILKPITSYRTISAHTPVQPALRFIFRLASNLASPTVIGSNGQGTRKVIPLTTGRLSSSGVDGRDGPEAFDGAICLEGGADYMTVDALGDARLDARYVFRLVSGHNLYFQSSGRRFVPSSDPASESALAAGQDIDPAKYYFRLKLVLESDDPHQDVQEACRKIVVASAVRGESSIVYDAYVLD